MLILREAEVIGALPANIGLPLRHQGRQIIPRVGPLHNLQKQAFSIIQINQKLIRPHLNDMILRIDQKSTCLNSVFYDILIKVPELLPQSLM